MNSEEVVGFQPHVYIQKMEPNSAVVARDLQVFEFDHEGHLKHRHLDMFSWVFIKTS